MQGISNSNLGFELADDSVTPEPSTCPSTEYVDLVSKREAEEELREAIDEVVAEEGDFHSVADEDSNYESLLALAALQPERLKKITVQLPPSTLIFPSSVCVNFEPPTKLVGEGQAVQTLLIADPTQKDEDYIEFELDKFSCYVDTTQYDCEMRALHSHATFTGKETFYFDGILRAGSVECYVQKVAFDEVPLGNYGEKEPTIGDQMWIRSLHNRRREIYYKLKTPRLEYARYHTKFVWVADLAKHVVDFCTYLLDELDCDISLRLFKEEFSTWLRATHKKNTTFQQWYVQRGSDDFRQSIVANCSYIRKEISSMFKPKQLRRIIIFREISSPFNAIPAQRGKLSKGEYPPTIVTPYIYECFSHLESGKVLKAVEPSFSMDKAIDKLWLKNKSKGSTFTRKGTCGIAEAIASRIQPGQLISTPPDETTQWKTSKIDKKWYGLVQKVHIDRKGHRQFDVTWLYQPEDTPCCSMRYPWDNELFLSNHCTCGESESLMKVHGDQVLGVHSVEWYGTPGTEAEFFVRQTYLSDERRFVTLQEAHRHCRHGKAASREYDNGETVLVKLPQSDYLEPCELIQYIDNSGSQVRLRRFKRRNDFAIGCPPNELVYTEDEICCAVSSIATRCIIRCYSPNEQIPMPYNQRGVGNAFFITHRLQQNGLLRPWIPDTDQPTFHLGFDPAENFEKLRALDLFSGFGNFGRGLEDGGAVEAKWANDIWDVAAHAYMANSRDPKLVSPFLGSIDDLLGQALEGNFSRSVPRPDEVDVIVGGSPCQGFSLITAHKASLRQMKNRSMIASFASTVDFWRPRWGILENVRNIVKSSKDVTEDCFSQLICALVGMGYQTQIILGDAWSFGAPQGRTRVFLCFAAPGLRLPQPPHPSHSSPKGKTSGCLGRMTNDEPYVQRENKPTAFKYVTASEATADLLDIYDSKPDTCVNFPDHRLSVGITTGHGHYGPRKQIRSIPAGPYGVNFSKAYYQRPPDLFPNEARLFPLGTDRTKQISKAWGRQHPQQLFGTITTSCQYSDARTGGNLMHWNQPRPLSIMEARRAQGVPDDEILCGTPHEQWKLVGNAVARQMSLALGLMLREAWRGTLYEGSVDELLVANAVPALSASVAANVAIIRDDGGERQPIPIWVEDNDDDDDSSNDVKSLGDLMLQVDADPTSSTRATSLSEVQYGSRDGAASAAVAPAEIYGGVDGKKKRPLSMFYFACAGQPPLSSCTKSPPLKKQRVMIEISDDEEEGAANEGTILQARSAKGATVVRLSPEESV